MNNFTYIILFVVFSSLGLKACATLQALENHEEYFPTQSTQEKTDNRRIPPECRNKFLDEIFGECDEWHKD